MKVIGFGAFDGCTSLTSVTIPDRVTTIDFGTFRDCTSLSSITIPHGVTSIGKDAFRGCTHLTSVIIPTSVISIDKNAFEGCPNLTIYYAYDCMPQEWDEEWNPDSRPVRWGQDKIPSDTDTLRTPSTAILATSTPVSPISSVYSQGLLFRSLDDETYEVSGMGTCKDTDVVIPPCTPDGGKVTTLGRCAFRFDCRLASAIIPSGVTLIQERVFENCRSLTSVTIPDSVTAIDSRAFKDCASLTSISIPSGVIAIDSRTFENCTSLNSVTISNGVMTICPNAFRGCTSLTSITLPSSVTWIREEAFRGCTNLTSVFIPGRVDWIDKHAFEGCPNLTIYCAHDSMPEGWDEEWNPDHRPVQWNCK